jgi:hypothetical protein
MGAIKRGTAMNDGPHTISFADPTLRRPQSRAIARAIDDDRRWFERNPDRTLRVRKPVAGEVEAMGCPYQEKEGYPARIFVFQHCPGQRMRRVFFTIMSIDAPESVALAFVGLVEQANQRGYSGEVTAEDLIAAMGEEVSLRRH